MANLFLENFKMGIAVSLCRFFSNHDLLKSTHVREDNAQYDNENMEIKF